MEYFKKALPCFTMFYKAEPCKNVFYRGVRVSVTVVLPLESPALLRRASYLR